MTMTAIDPQTRATIKAYLEVFIENLVSYHQNRPASAFDNPASYLARVSDAARLKPFHAAIMPEALLRIAAFERSFSTRLGTTFEECARLIALKHHADARRSHDIHGTISRTAIGEIERQVARFEHAAVGQSPKPTFEQMVQAVLQADDTQQTQERSVRVDLYIRTYAGQELYFEMKSPVPNKGQCLEVMQRLLRIYLLRGQAAPTVQTYFAMAYNPFGPDGSDYHWTYALNYLPFDQVTLIGREFWSIVGGETAYQELLDIYQEVGHDKTKFILDRLGFGF